MDGDLVPLVADVATSEGAASFIVEATEAMGRVDILVTNAGGPPPGTFESTQMDGYIDTVQLNACRSWPCVGRPCRPCRSRMGRVIAITSMGVRQPIPRLG